MTPNSFEKEQQSADGAGGEKYAKNTLTKSSTLPPADQCINDALKNYVRYSLEAGNLATSECLKVCMSECLYL